MLIRLYASNNDARAAIDLVNAESDESVTPHMLAAAISACSGGGGGIDNRGGDKGISGSGDRGYDDDMDTGSSSSDSSSICIP